MAMREADGALDAAVAAWEAGGPASAVREAADAVRALADTLPYDFDHRNFRPARDFGDVFMSAAQRRAGLDALGGWERPRAASALAIDIETTATYAGRGHIVDVGWRSLCPAEGWAGGACGSRTFGLPDEAACWPHVPLCHIHHVDWDDVRDRAPLRLDAAAQARLLGLMASHRILVAHNAGFEDTWLSLHVDGYLEARRAGEVLLVDTMDAVRELDPHASDLPYRCHPFKLETWAKRLRVLSRDEREQHRGLGDSDLMVECIRAQLRENAAA